MGWVFLVAFVPLAIASIYFNRSVEEAKPHFPNELSGIFAKNELRKLIWRNEFPPPARRNWIVASAWVCVFMGALTTLAGFRGLWLAALAGAAVTIYLFGKTVAAFIRDRKLLDPTR